MELLIGCGSRQHKDISIAGNSHFTNLVTLDIDPVHNPTVVHDLNTIPLPFDDDTFDEIHAYEVLEHVGTQGDWRFFFDQFADFWRILRPNGWFCGSVPRPDSPWAWGDPGHTRVLPLQAFLFLEQGKYDREVGVTSCTDYRSHYKADFRIFEVEAKGLDSESAYFALQAIKEQP